MKCGGRTSPTFRKSAARFMRVTLDWVRSVMDATLNPKQTDPRHVLVARAEEEFAHVYEQITRADEQLLKLGTMPRALLSRASGHR